MIIKGKYNEAIVYTDVIESSAIDQIREMCNTECFKDSKIRIMPDVHTGTSCTIGTTMTLVDKVVPNMVGVDIGCGMELVQIKEKELDLQKLDELIRRKIPSGMNCRKTHHKFAKKIDLSGLKCIDKVNDALAYCSIGTLGGGNHFIEVDKDADGNLYIVVHSGSRHLGLEVAGYYQENAYREMCGNSEAQLREMIAEMKAKGKHKEIERTVKQVKARKIGYPRDMAYAQGKLFDDYIQDMKLVQAFASLNRKAMIEDIVKGLGLHIVEQFTTIHNYIDTERMILRKGAVSAQKGEKLLIPINMRDGSLICVGKGNAEWNCSAPHGAGRLLSRGKARATLSMEEYEKEMQGIYSTSVNFKTIDESPMAYKKIEDIVNNITPTVDIVKRIQPIYNFKANE